MTNLETNNVTVKNRNTINGQLAKKTLMSTRDKLML